LFYHKVWREKAVINLFRVVEANNVRQFFGFLNAPSRQLFRGLNGHLLYSLFKMGKQIRNISLGRLGTHTFRHTYRSWLDAVGTAITVQQKLMWHSDIQTTLNIYGDVVTSEMKEARSRVAGLALEN
jgi:integrase